MTCTFAIGILASLCMFFIVPMLFYHVYISCKRETTYEQVSAAGAGTPTGEAIACLVRKQRGSAGTRYERHVRVSAVA